MIPRIFVDGLPKELEKRTKADLRLAVTLMPHWVEELCVKCFCDGRSEDDSNAYIAMVMPQPEYKRATMHLNVDFFLLDEEGRAKTIAHECAHSMMAEMFEWCESVLPEGDDRFSSLYKKELLRRYELASTEIGNLMARLYMASEPRVKK